MSNRLPVLADEIRAKHDAAVGAIKAGITYALECGDALLEAKALVKHGQWRAWLADNTSLSERSAQRYMRLAKERPTLEAKSATVADLTIRGACDLIAKAPDKLSEMVGVVRYMPAAGNSRLAIARNPAGADVLMITPYTSPDYFYITHIWAPVERDESEPLAGSTMLFSAKPVRYQWLPQAVLQMIGVDMSAAEWTEQPYTGPTDRNPFGERPPVCSKAMWEMLFPGEPFEEAA